MNTKKTVITLAAILGFALVITGCSGSNFGIDKGVDIGTVVANWQTGTPTYLNSSEGQRVYGEINAAPTIVDFDGNGTLDLVVGDIYGYLEVMLNGSTTGLEIQSSYMIGNASGPGYFCDDVTPIFLDADNDGQSEMVLGCGDGSVLYVNFTDLTPNAMQYTIEPIISDGAPLIVPGGYAVPAIFDSDGDGVSELLATSGDGPLYLYQYVEMNGAPAPVMTSDGSTENFGYRAALVTAELSADGDTEFLVGKGDGLVQVCESLTPTACLDVIQTVGLAKPAVGDFNHDGLPDLVIGTIDGSIQVIIATPNAP